MSDYRTLHLLEFSAIWSGILVLLVAIQSNFFQIRQIRHPLDLAQQVHLLLSLLVSCFDKQAHDSRVKMSLREEVSRRRHFHKSHLKIHSQLEVLSLFSPLCQELRECYRKSLPEVPLFQPRILARVRRISLGQLQYRTTSASECLHSSKPSPCLIPIEECRSRLSISECLCLNFLPVCLRFLEDHQLQILLAHIWVLERRS